MPPSRCGRAVGCSGQCSPGSDGGLWSSRAAVVCWTGSRDLDCWRVRGRVWLFVKRYVVLESCEDRVPWLCFGLESVKARPDRESLGFGWIFVIAKKSSSCKRGVYCIVYW